MWFSELVSKSAPKIIAVGKNYLKHAIEMGGTSVPKEPLIFLKPWSSISYAPKRLNLSQSGRSNEVHHEIELGVVIGKTGYQIKKGDAHNFIKGYILALDLTDRGNYYLMKIFKRQLKRQDSLGIFQKVRTTTAQSVNLLMLRISKIHIMLKYNSTLMIN